MSEKLTKEQLRTARLRAMGLLQEEETTSTCTITSQQVPTQRQKHSIDPRAWKVLQEGGGATLDDLSRWQRQGFELTKLANFSVGLSQKEGGPCGVLAAVQAELLVHVCFSGN